MYKNLPEDKYPSEESNSSELEDNLSDEDDEDDRDYSNFKSICIIYLAFKVPSLIGYFLLTIFVDRCRLLLWFSCLPLFQR